MEFDAFVSYSHAADGRLAPAVQRGMQRLAKPWYTARALRVFRDETALSASPQLWSSICSALDASQWFVLLASPEAAASEWVNRELRHWLATKCVDRILVVVTDGSWRWDPAARELTGSAVPDALRGAFDDEPRHVDLRWARGALELDLRHGRFRDVVAQLAAPVHGVAKDELESEDVRLHQRARRLARGATTLLVLLTVLSLALGVFAWFQRAQARHETARARREERAVQRGEQVILAHSLAGDASAALRAGRTDLGLLLAVEAERAAPSVESDGSLLSAIVDQPMLDRQLHGLTGTTTPLAFSSDGRWFAAVGDRLRIWDLSTGRPRLDQPPVSAGSFADHGRLFVGSANSRLDVWDLATRRKIHSLPIAGPNWSASDNAAVLADYNTNGTIEVWSLRTGKRTTVISTLPESGPQSWFAGSAVGVSEDGSTVAFVTKTVSTSPTGQFDNGVSARGWRIATSRAIGPGCSGLAAPSGSEVALVGLHLGTDDTTVRAVNADSFGSSAFLVTCHLDTGESGSRTYQPRGKGFSSVAAASPDGRMMAMRDGSTIQLVKATDGSLIGSPERAPYGGWMIPLTNTGVFSPDGRLFAASEFDGDVRIWRANARTPIERTVWNPPDVADAFNTAHGHFVITGHGKVVDLETRQTVAQVPNFRPIGPSIDTWTAAAMSDDGRIIATLTANQLTILDRKRHTTRTEDVNLACASVGGLAVSATLAVVSCSTDSVIQAVNFSIRRWQVGAPVKLPHRGRQVLAPGSLTFSPDGHVLAVYGSAGCCDGIELVDIHDAQLDPRPPAALERGVSGVFTPDSRSFILAHGDGRVVRLPILPGTGSTIDIAQPGAGVQAIVAVSPDSHLLATANTDNSLALWDLATRQLVATIPGPDPEGSGPLTAYDESSLTIGRERIDLSPGTLEEVACHIANRNLTRAESAQYLPGIRYHKTCANVP